jgi:hypothetical protein
LKELLKIVVPAEPVGVDVVEFPIASIDTHISLLNPGVPLTDPEVPEL